MKEYWADLIFKKNEETIVLLIASISKFKGSEVFFCQKNLIKTLVYLNIVTIFATAKGN